VDLMQICSPDTILLSLGHNGVTFWALGLNKSKSYYVSPPRLWPLGDATPKLIHLPEGSYAAPQNVRQADI
jgi:hypothetical protein